MNAELTRWQNRLAAIDYDRMVERVSERITEWSTSTAALVASDILALTRLAYHAIGCCEADLRESELVAIDQLVDALLEGEAGR